MRQQVGGSITGGGLRVWWKEAKANGAPIIVYTLQAAPYIDNLTYVTVYNGSSMLSFHLASFHFRVFKYCSFTIVL